jgi:long-subunit acyl-CoA synthetase (AMP-forming)
MSPLREAIARAPAARTAFSDGSVGISYRELGESVDAERCWLAAHQVERCALLADNGCGWAIADLALLELGAVNLPLPTFFTAAQQRHAVQDAGIDAVLTDRGGEFTAAFPEFRSAGQSPNSHLVLLRRTPPEPRAPLPAGTVKVTYTSGSTGDPKGIALSAATLVAVSQSLATAVAGAHVSRHLCLLPLATLLENLTAIHVPLLLGARAELPSSERSGIRYGSLDPQRLVPSIAASRAHSLVLVPELLRALVAIRRAGGPEVAAALGHLRFIAVGGAPVSPALLEEAESLGLPVYEGYGLSECGSVVCLNTPGARRRGSVGRALPHVRLRVDAQGEIHVSGRPIGEGGFGEIATGDLGEVDADGFVYVRGRRRNRFITSFGRNVTPEWVERELLHEREVARAMVIGESRPWVAALLWTRNPTEDPVAIDAAVTRANARLPDYAQVRAWVRAPDGPAELGEMLTANGRLRREAAMRRHGERLEALYRQSST